MFARVTVVDGPPGQFDKAKDLINTHAAPRTRGLRGHRASYWLGNPKTGRVVAVALYNTEKDLTEKDLQESADKVTEWKKELVRKPVERSSP
jgi:hypothetical protein